MSSQVTKLDAEYIKEFKQNANIDDQPIRAVIYTRVSTEMQPQSALDSQEAVAKEFAELNDIEIIKVYSDKGISGTTDQRPSFQDMIKYVKAEENDIQMIIVYKLDRFFRNEQLHHVYDYKLSKHGVFVLSATEDTYKSDMGTRVLKAVTLINNENEAVKIRQNVKRGQIHTANQGKTNGGIAPLGYDINEEGNYVINKDEEKIVVIIFTMRAKGFTYVQIANELNKKHYKTKIGRKFTKYSFHEIITNPKYKGEFTYNRSVSVSEHGKRPNRHKYKDKSEIVVVKGKIEPIVSEELWESVQPKRHVGAKKRNGKYLLSGLVKCPVCGKAYQVDNKNGVKYLRHSKGKGETCTNSVLMDDVEKKVIQKVINKIYSKENIGYFVSNFSQISRQQSIQVKDKVDTLNRRIKSYKAKYDNLIESLSTITDKAIVADIEDKLKDNQACIQALQKELKELKRGIPRKPSEEEVLKSKIKLKRYMKNPQNIIPTSQLLRDMIEGVYIHDGNIKIKFNM